MKAAANRSVTFLSILIVSSLFLVPLFLTLGGLNLGSLSGEINKRKTVSLTVETILNLNFQNTFESLFQDKTGLIGALVRTDNQLNYYLFNQISSNPKSTVLLGNSNQLIERPYIRGLNRLSSVTADRINTFVAELGLFQGELKKLGIAFILAISPSKPAFYPEYVPDSYKVDGVTDRFDSLTHMITKLNERDIHYINAAKLLKEKEAVLNQPMFAATGTHWNELGGCLTAKEILAVGSRLHNAPMPTIDCRIVGTRSRPAYQDRDLLRLANLWFPEALEEDAPDLHPVGIKSEKSVKAPNLLIIGSSFCWELLRQFERTRTTASNEFLYYFKRRVFNSSQKGHPIDRANFDFEKSLSNKDLVVIEMNESFLKRSGYSFPRQYLKWRLKRERLNATTVAGNYDVKGIAGS